jgi:hypothetical protein
LKCRHCSFQLEHSVIDLGHAPISNAYLTSNELCCPEKYYPLKVRVCTNCWLVQIEDQASPGDLFCSDYAYYSSTSSSWLAHAANFAMTVTEKLCLNSKSLVIEVASNDGYLLKNFVAAGIPCLGIEPTASTADIAERLGIPTLRKFFGEALARQLAANGQQADLICGNNVYAHVPDINDFTRGLKAALKPNGTITLEFPHLKNLIECTQFDTVYHEHFSYLSLDVVNRIFKAAELRIWDVQRLLTHGGSLRIFGCHTEDNRADTEALTTLLSEERLSGLQNLDTYQGFQARAEKIKYDLLNFLINKKLAHKKVAAYGAAAKGNTLINYAGIKPDLLPAVYDASEGKQNKYLPGSHIPILPIAALKDNPPDYLLILPWNIANEIKEQNVDLLHRGVKFVTATPALMIHN